MDAERLRELLHYDPLTGLFTWRVDRMCGRHGKQFAARAGQRAGNITKGGRVQIRVDGVNYKGHILAWLYMTGEMPDCEIDHRDTVASNNAWRNLRRATRHINNQNRRRPNRTNKLGVLGVRRHYMKFAAYITIGGRNTYLGLFDSADAAHAAYLAAKRQHHPGCTL